MMDGVWKAVYDSVAGTSHEGTGLPCQDACRVVQLAREDGDLLVACVSDGAGSATYSADGASIACDAFVRIIDRDLSGSEIGENVTHEVVVGWLNELRTLVEERAKEIETRSRELASTFLGTVIGLKSALFVQIGDGAIVISDEQNGIYRPVFWPQSGEFANTTNFLTDDLFEARFEWQRLDESVNEFAMFSDGLERLILRFDDRSAYKPFLSPFFSAMRTSEDCEKFFGPLREFLGSSKVNERTDDDKTLVLATRVN